MRHRPIPLLTFCLTTPTGVRLDICHPVIEWGCYSIEDIKLMVDIFKYLVECGEKDIVRLTEKK